jgi:hypothetical protein
MNRLQFEKMMTRRVASVAFAFITTIALASGANAQCSFSCPTADETEIQAALDAAAAAGGGIVQLEPRVYFTCAALIVGSNTHLRGAGRGVTIIRGSSNLSPSTFIGGTHAAATIAAVAARNVKVSDLTIDHLSCERNCNGVSLLPSTSPDVITTNSVIANVEVLGSGNPSLHNYMIWNLRGRGIRIVDNLVDGGLTSNAPQEGIESFGGYDVLISGNTVRNVGGACINTGSADLPDSETDGITISENYLADCGVGINLGTSNGAYGVQSSTSMRMIDNVIIRPRMYGIKIATTAGTTLHDLTIARNTIRDMNGSGAVGINMFASGGSLTASSTAAHTVSENHISNIRGAFAHGVRLTSYPNVRILNNTIAGVDHGAVYATNSSDLEVAGNKIVDGGAAPIQLNSYQEIGFDRFVVDKNTIEWNGGSAAVLVLGGRRGIVRDNVMQRASMASTPAPVSLGQGTCGAIVQRNIAWYYPTWPSVSSPNCP